MTRRRIEPLVWLTFSGGGVAAATFLPVLALLFALALPLGWVEPDFAQVESVMTHPLTRLALLALFVPILVHSAHRFRYTLYDGLQVKHKVLVALACYGGAVVASFAAVLILAGASGG